MEIHCWAEVILPIPRYKTFYYGVPSELQGKLSKGALVKVSFGRKHSIGLIKNLFSKKPKLDYQLKNIESDFHGILFPKPLILLFDWASKHYLCPHGEVLRTVLPASLLKGKKSQGKRSKPLAEENEFSSSVSLELNVHQKKVCDGILKKSQEFSPSLLYGVTGSGKTEVYLYLAGRYTGLSKSCLILVPEIALTPQLVGRFQSRFGESVLSYHSGLTDAQRLKVWWEVYEGNPKIIVGTRSSLFLPFKNLGFIVVDEEQDASYKQEERFRYHGRDIAVMRAYFEKIPILLGSATPSMETFENVQKGKYTRWDLPVRATESDLPHVELVDLRKENWDRDSFLSGPLITALKTCLEQKEQAILFLNRRGFSPFLLCLNCGEALRCPNCEISLIYHQHPKKLKCHYCELTKDVPLLCPGCHGKHLDPIGVGTQRLEQRVAQLFPKARIARLDRDSTTKAGSSSKILGDFLTGKLDVLVGTQLVVKGHDFPRLTLVGVLMADQGLHMTDFRASERTFQMMTQVAGRSGRHALPGKVLIQTFNPENRALVHALSQNAYKFFEEEIQLRQALAYPPVSRMVSMRFTGLQRQKVQEVSQFAAKKMRAIFPCLQDLEILGPAPAPMEKLRAKYRWHFLLKVKNWKKIHPELLKWIPWLEEKLPSGVGICIDVDPIHLL